VYQIQTKGVLSQTTSIRIQRADHIFPFMKPFHAVRETDIERESVLMQIKECAAFEVGFEFRPFRSAIISQAPADRPKGKINLSALQRLSFNSTETLCQDELVSSIRVCGDIEGRSFG